MYIRNRNLEVDGRKGIVSMGWISECRECSVKSQCVRYPDRMVARQVCFFYEKAKDGELTFTEKMKRKDDIAVQEVGLNENQTQKNLILKEQVNRNRVFLQNR